MPNQFIHAYQFVGLPLDGDGAVKRVGAVAAGKVAQTLGAKPVNWKSWQPDAAEMLHDRYPVDVQTEADGEPSEKQATYSGRIDCTLTTKSPCVFGNRHRKITINEPGKDPIRTTIVDNLVIRRDGESRAGIAGTTLKGMFSTLAEMASGSAMRVLKNRAMSVRSSMTQSRSAVGVIVMHEGRRKLLPLTLPNHKWEPRDSCWKPISIADSEIWAQIIQRRLQLGMQNWPWMPIYIDRYKNTSYSDLTYYPNNKILSVHCADYKDVAIDKKGLLKHRNLQSQFIKKNGGNILRPFKFEPRPHVTQYGVADNAETLHGICRRLEEPAQPKQAEPTFDMFIPLPDFLIDKERGVFTWPEDADKPLCDLLLDAEGACRLFDTITAHPGSTAPSDRSATTQVGRDGFALLDKLPKTGLPPQVKAGDVVFFDPESASVVASVSFSSIWREGVRWLWEAEAGTGADADSNSARDYALVGDADQVPMNRRRTGVTMAEKLFGWVMDDSVDAGKVEGETDSIPNAYRGRVRFSDAVSVKPIDECLFKEYGSNAIVTFLYKRGSGVSKNLLGLHPLKILASPKLPCPEFYFTGGGTSIRKKLFDQAANVFMQGWKFYVLNPKTLVEEQGDGPVDWRSSSISDSELKRMKQICWVRPVRRDIKFNFHVEFENLTDDELRLLCYALKPGNDYLHRLGLGKPLGLGVVKVEAAEIRIVNRVSRCRDETEWFTRADETRFRRPDHTESVDTYAAEFATGIGDRHKIIVRSGQTLAYIQVPVQYPTMRKQDPESELFQWSVANRETDDGGVAAYLRPLSPNEAIPSMPAGIRVVINKSQFNIQFIRDVKNGVKRLSRETGVPIVLKELLPDRFASDDDYEFCIGFSNKDRNMQLANGLSSQEVVEQIALRV